MTEFEIDALVYYNAGYESEDYEGEMFYPCSYMGMLGNMHCLRDVGSGMIIQTDDDSLIVHPDELHDLG